MRFLAARSIYRLMMASTLLPIAAASSAQERNGQVAQSLVGLVGQRQLGVRALPARPTARINNRVQARLRNRIDRFYDPAANAASPFEVAGDQVRARRR